MKPLFLALTLASFPIGWVASRLLLAILFYAVFTPAGWAMRLMGRDALQLRRDSDRYSYWEPKEIVVDPHRYFRPF